VAAATLTCAWVLAFPQVLGGHSRALSTLAATICGLAGGLLLAAGVLLAGRWRLTGDHCAGAAAAAMVLGFCLPVLAIADPLLQPAGATVHVTTARLLIILPTLLLLLVGGHARAWPVAPPLVSLLVFACWLAAIIGLASSPDRGEWLWSSARAVVLHGVASLCWLALARRVWSGARRDDRPLQHWVAFALTLMATCAAAQVWASTDRHVPTELVPLLQLTAAVVIVTAVGLELHASLRAMAGHRLAVAHSLGAVHATLSETEQQHRQRVHDARTAVVALDAAARLLTPSADTASEEHSRIKTLMSAELNRLRARLDPDLVEPVVEFGLADVLDPVLFAHQLCGAALRSDLGEIRVLGRPSATATVVANLLANARAHAPGAVTEIHARRAGAHVHIVVEDDGPGISARERARVLRPGACGTASNPGSGLGLYSALTAMTGQGGTLQIGARPQGGTRITLTLPAAARAPSAAVGVS
jgi:signal transduction histidine kinase